MKKYDLAIVGGSFSGLACANSASVRGLNTVVFDKKKGRRIFYSEHWNFRKRNTQSYIILPRNLGSSFSIIRLFLNIDERN